MSESSSSQEKGTLADPGESQETPEQGAGGLVLTWSVYLKATVEDSSALFDLVGDDLQAADRVRGSFNQALKDREAVFPTGLPVNGGVAIPHTDAVHVLVDTIAVVTLAHPIPFVVMAGAEDNVIDVSTVFVLALSDPEQHVSLLPRIVKCIQDSGFIQALHEADDPDVIVRLANRAFAAA